MINKICKEVDEMNEENKAKVVAQKEVIIPKKA